MDNLFIFKLHDWMENAAVVPNVFSLGMGCKAFHLSAVNDFAQPNLNRFPKYCNRLTCTPVGPWRILHHKKI